MEKTFFCQIKAILFAILFTSISTFSFAQHQADPLDEPAREEFSEEEIDSFVSATKEVIKLQSEIEQEMIQAIEDSNLTVERFNEIMMAQQNQQNPEGAATEEELEAFSEAAQKIIEIQSEMQEEIFNVLNEEGLDVNTYQEIIMAYQQDPELQRKIDSKLEEEIANDDEMEKPRRKKK
jgi:membrane-associated HD superfamily phosphohydrolase